jgi:hypothetical protein
MFGAEVWFLTGRQMAFDLSQVMKDPLVIRAQYGCGIFSVKVQVNIKI